MLIRQEERLRFRPIQLVIWLLAIVTTIAGGWISYKLTVLHLRESARQAQQAAEKEEAEEMGFVQEICEGSEAWSCDEVATSRWGVFPFGAKEAGKPYVPTSLLGLFFFTAILCWLVLVGICSPDRWWAHLILTAGVTVGLGVSIFFEYIMWTQVDKPCKLCLVTHVASLFLFVFALLLWPRRPKAERDATGGKAAADAAAARAADTGSYGSTWPHWWALAVTPLVAILAIQLEYHYFVALSYAIQPKPAPGETETSKEELEESTREELIAKVQEVEKKLKATEFRKDYAVKLFARYNRYWQNPYTVWRATPSVEIVTEGEPARGPANARHTMVIWSDFQCPYCRQFENLVKKLVVPTAEQLGGIKVIFKHWPICTDCNPRAGNNSHPKACLASRAVEAARIVGGEEAFWKMHDLVWEHQADWKKSGSFVEYAREIGLNEQAFTKAMDSDEALARIHKHVNEGAALGDQVDNARDQKYISVNSTPTVFINGKRLFQSKRTEQAYWRQIFSTPVQAAEAESDSSRDRAATITGARTRPASGG